MKDCLYTPKNSKKDYSYDEFRAYLLRNHSWWSDVAKDLAPSVLSYKQATAASVSAAPTTEGKSTATPTSTQTAKNKVVLSKTTQRIKAGFDAITKAMGLKPKVEFLTEEQARKMLATRNDLSKLIAGYGMTKEDLRAAVKFGLAMELSNRKIDPKKIKLQTGWERGADGDWRYEMGDAKIKKSAFNQLIANNEAIFDDLMAAEEDPEQFTTKFLLKDLINANSELLKKYPDAGNIEIVFPPLSGVEENLESTSVMLGLFEPMENRITIYLPGTEIEDINIDRIETTLNHELQHYIQIVENFAQGGVPEMFRLTDSAKDTQSDIALTYKLYQHLAGEVESRNVEKRRKLTAAERLRILLEETEDVPRINQIVVKDVATIGEGADFVVEADGEIRGGSDADIMDRIKKQNWKEWDSDYMEPDFLKSPDGKVLGFVAKTKDGGYQIYIDPTAVGSETPIHEIAGHIFLPLIKEVAPEVYNRGVELVKGSEYEKRLKGLGYAFKTKEETYAEALAQAVGDRGAKLSASLKDKFLEWLKTMWQKVGDILKINITPEKLQSMKLGEFADFIAGSIVYGQELSEMEASPLVAPPGNTLFTPEQADALIEQNINTAYENVITTNPKMATLGRDAYKGQAAKKIADKGNNIIAAIKEDVKTYLTKGAVGIQKYTGAAAEFIKTIATEVKKAAIIAAIAISGIVGTMKAMDTNAFVAAANSIKTELVNSGILSPAVAKESATQIKNEIAKAFEGATDGKSNKPSAPPMEAIVFAAAIPIATRKRVYAAIKGMNLADAKEAATNVMQQDGVSQEDINAVNAQIDERYAAVSDAQLLANHIEKLRAAQKLTAAQAKSLMHHFRNYLNSEEDLQEAMEFVDRLSEQKNLMEKLAKAKVAFRKLKSIRNSKKLTIYDKQLAGKLATPKYYLLSEEEMDKVIAMANDFYDSRLSSKAGRYTAEEMINFFDEVGAKRPKRTRRTTGSRRATTVAMLQFSVEQALADFARRLPLAAELSRMDLSVLGKDKDTLQRILNSLKAFDETGIVYDLGNIVETVRALNEVKILRKSPVISKLARLAAGGISARLQFDELNAADIRRILFGGWDRNAPRATAENNKERLEIDIKFDKLNIGIEDRFLLGSYAFFKEISGGQTPNIKASALANQMNDLKNRIEKAAQYGITSETVNQYQHYYTGATQALSRLNVIKLINDNWVANQFESNEGFLKTIEENTPDNIKQAWDFGQKILQSKHDAYVEAMQSYHGKRFDDIENYWPRTYIGATVKAGDIQDTGTQIPGMENLGSDPTTQKKDIAGRNRGRQTMPETGGFYVLDGYENLNNGLWEINATINLSKDYVYTNVLINQTAMVENRETNSALKKYMVSSISGILRDPLLFVDTRNNWEKAGGLIMNAATSTILNNFTQLAKQTQALWQGLLANPKGMVAANRLTLMAIKNPELKEALNKFWNNTSEPYTSQLAHIELETAYRVQPNKYSKGVNNLLSFLNPQSLIKANRQTQRLLLLSEYLAERGYSSNPERIIDDAENGFDATALAAAENNAEAANSTANRHFLPMQLKNADMYKKFLYFLGTYTFVAVNQFFNNINIVRNPGYTEYQKRVAWTQIGGFLVQQMMFQIVSKAIYEGLREMGRKLDWLEEEDPEEKKKRRDKYWYQTTGQMIMDIATGWLPSFWSDSIKLSVNWVAETLQDKTSSNEEEMKSKVDLLFKKSNELPGPLGVVGGMFENVWKAVETKDDELIAYQMGQIAAMVAQLGDVYLILKLKSQAVKSLLSAEGNEDVFKAMRHTNPSQYKSYVDEVRRAGVPDEVLHYMAWKEGESGYYVPAKNAARFYKLFQQNYNEEYSYLKGNSEGMSDTKIKQSARNAAAASTQYEFDPVEIDLTEILKSKK